MVKSVFDDRALQWDTPQRVGLSQITVEAMRSRVHFDRTMTVLDFAAGTGLVSMALRDEVARIVSLDSSAGMLEILKKKRELYGAKNVEAILGDEHALEAFPCVFDCIVSAMALHHVENYHHLLECFYRALTVNGRVLIADLAREDGDFHADNTGVYHFGFDDGEITAALKEAGFSEVRYDIFHVMNREVQGGERKEFPLFMATGTRLKQ